MEPQFPWYVSLIIAWLPFIFMSALWYWIIRTINGSLRASSGYSVGQVIEEVGAELKRSNERLEALLKDCRGRLDALEKPH
jgi:hypothetical protein